MKVGDRTQEFLFFHHGTYAFLKVVNAFKAFGFNVAVCLFVRNLFINLNKPQGYLFPSPFIYATCKIMMKNAARRIKGQLQRAPIVISDSFR